MKSKLFGRVKSDIPRPPPIWKRGNLHQRLGARIVRYADDIVILCRRTKTDKAMTILRHVLERLELTLNESKTKKVNAFKDKFDFLGFTIWMGTSRKTGNYYPHVQPSKKSLQVIKDRVTDLTKRSRTVKPLQGLVKEVNATVRGWVGYFHHGNCSKALEHVRGHVEERLRTHLRKRHKIKDRRTGYACTRTGFCTGNMVCTKCQHQRAGRKRMPRSEEHRKAVCGKTARTV